MKKIPHTYAITSTIILICALLTWIIPAGEYVRETINVNGTERTVIVDGSYHAVEANPQTYQVFEVVLEGFEKQAGIIAFLLIIGGAFQILNSTKTIDMSIRAFLRWTRKIERHKWISRIGVNNIVMTLIIFMFSTFGAVFGMSEETLPFVLILVPLAISMGYDSITGLCLVYVAAHVGFSGAILNPFTVGLAQGLAEIPLFSGASYRLICWLTLTSTLVAIVLWYAAKVKRTPTLSPMYEADAYWRLQQQQAEPIALDNTAESVSASAPHIRTSICRPEAFILLILLSTIIALVVGVMHYGWYITEISALFLAMGISSGYVYGMKTDEVIAEFIAGAKDILSAAMIVGLASGIILILQNGHIIDTILYNLALLMNQTSQAVTISLMYLIQTLINIIIPSGSAKAALTMPIMAPFSDVVGLSRQATVMAYQFGDGFTNMITPTSGVLMGALQMARIPYAVWVKWFWRILLAFALLGLLLLLPTVYFQLDGF